MTRRATHVHRAREKVHNNIAAAEDGDSYNDVQKSFLQLVLDGGRQAAWRLAVRSVGLVSIELWYAWPRS